VPKHRITVNGLVVLQNELDLELDARLRERGTAFGTCRVARGLGYLDRRAVQIRETGGVGDDGFAMVYVTSLNYADGNLDAVHTMLTDPHTIPGLSDGGAHVGTICDVSFPTTLLEHWVRERDRDRIPVEFIVQRQARDTARAVGLLDRGVLAPGYKADINVIDLDRVRLRRPQMSFDLPGGGRRLLQRAEGYRHTIVSGAEVYRDGEPTEDLPGRLVRGAQPAPAA